MSTCVGQYVPLYPFRLWTTVHQLYFTEQLVGLQLINYFSDFWYVDYSTCCGDICIQSRKWSEIASNFGRFFTLSNFRGQTFEKLYPCYHTGIV